MFTQWQELKDLQKEIHDALSGNVSPKQRASLQKRSADIARVLDCKAEVDEVQATLEKTQNAMQQEQDAELAELFALELEDLQQQLQDAQTRLQDSLYPADEFADRDAYVEIRAGAGGQEAALFVADVLKMYMQYAARIGWRFSITSESRTDLGGFKEVIAHISGKNAYGTLRKESGVHRVQRVPDTETSGRVHTSTVTVAVLPEAKEVDVDINPSDLRIDVFRASGAGGQHVNTTDSAVRITHIPSGVVVSCQDERSQHKNKAKAMKVLRSRILAHEQERQDQEQSQARKEQVGSGMRAEKIRTYNYPQNRVTDHQVNLTLKKLDMVMLGELDEILKALQDLQRHERQQKASLLSRSELGL